MAGITIEGVTRTYGSVRAIDDVSLAIRDGEFFTLLGPSGCGKTTLLRMVAGFADPDVRLLSVRAIVADSDDADPVPDGLHYNPQLRRRIAASIADAAAGHAARITESNEDRRPRP